MTGAPAMAAARGPAEPRAPADVIVLVRGAGDLATGVAWRLKRAGFGVIMCELEHPLTVRRSVAFSTAVGEGSVNVEGIRAVRATTVEAAALAHSDAVPVVVSPGLPPLPADVIVDARVAKRELDTAIGDAALVVALGPGSEAGRDCHAVIETMRGPRLGRVYWQGRAAPNTGTPAVIGGRGAERVRAPFAGVVRGLIADGTPVAQGLKIGDIDPRADTHWREISDKALAVAGGVLEAILTWLSPRTGGRARSGSRPPGRDR